MMDGYGLGWCCGVAGGASWVASGFTNPLLFAVLGAVLLIAAAWLCWEFG